MYLLLDYYSSKQQLVRPLSQRDLLAEQQEYKLQPPPIFYKYFSLAGST